MVYKQFKELKLSTIGMGNMRLPSIGEGRGGEIDEEKARELIEYAYENGINYFDTAYGYHGGNSEIFTGKILNKYPRDTWYLASKMPGHMLDYKDGKYSYSGYLTGQPAMTPQEIFEKQLEKCGVNYFDFYLLHNVCETSFDFYTNEEIGIVKYLLEQKAAGRIHHLGFSAHGRTKTIEKFLDIYDCFEFAQIQINYMDWTLQDAKGKYELLTRREIPVVAMEPVRGGALADLGAVGNAVLKAAKPDDTIASWAFRYLQALPNMAVVLSGMSTMEQLKENLELFSKPEPVTEAEIAVINKALETRMSLVPCTACRYCCDSCPQSLDIPKLISMANEASISGIGILQYNIGAMSEGEMPAACIACGACSPLCPQNIDIPAVLAKFAEALK